MRSGPSRFVDGSKLIERPSAPDFSDSDSAGSLTNPTHSLSVQVSLAHPPSSARPLLYVRPPQTTELDGATKYSYDDGPVGLTFPPKTEEDDDDR